jgi:Lhr-like helicase
MPVLKAKALDPAPRTRAIVIYPMNALANSQLEELASSWVTNGSARPVTFGSYTGQERDEERQRLAANPPDILLTNFMMLELLMTRQDDKDKAVMRNAKGLRFLVLDELHTYRGRQGADVALLVRRVREALADKLICIGTSATMATEGPEEERNAVSRRSRRRLFGTTITPATCHHRDAASHNPGGADGCEPCAPLLATPYRPACPMARSFDDMAKHPFRSGSS